jgi:hypothetical protein
VARDGALDPEARAALLEGIELGAEAARDEGMPREGAALGAERAGAEGRADGADGRDAGAEGRAAGADGRAAGAEPRPAELPPPPPPPGRPPCAPRWARRSGVAANRIAAAKADTAKRRRGRWMVMDGSSLGAGSPQVGKRSAVAGPSVREDVEGTRTAALDPF